MGKRGLFKRIDVKRSELLTTLRRARRTGSIESAGENLAAVFLTMDADEIQKLLDDLPQPTSIDVVEYVVRAEASLSSRHAMTRTALARLGLTAGGGSHG